MPHQQSHKARPINPSRGQIVIALKYRRMGNTSFRGLPVLEKKEKELGGGRGEKKETKKTHLES